MKQSKWVCNTFTTNGYTPTNVEAYACSGAGCTHKGGHKLFVEQDIKDLRRGARTTVRCLTCKARTEQHGEKKKGKRTYTER